MSTSLSSQRLLCSREIFNFSWMARSYPRRKGTIAMCTLQTDILFMSACSVPTKTAFRLARSNSQRRALSRWLRNSASASRMKTMSEFRTATVCNIPCRCRAQHHLFAYRQPLSTRLSSPFRLHDGILPRQSLPNGDRCYPYITPRQPSRVETHLDMSRIVLYPPEVPLFLKAALMRTRLCFGSSASVLSVLVLS